MDIQKLLEYKQIDMNYNRTRQKENEMLRNTINQKKDTIDTSQNYLIDMGELKFITVDTSPMCEIFFELIGTLLTDKSLFNRMIISGSWIRSMIIDSSRPVMPLRNEVRLMFWGDLSFDQIIKEADMVKKNDLNITIDHRIFDSPIHCILNQTDPLDRIGFDVASGRLYCSHMFILQLRDRYNEYDPNETDPVFGFPVDYLDIMNREQDTASITKLVDIVDLKTINTIDLSEFADKFFEEPDGQQYTLLEYCMTVMMKDMHPMVMSNLRLIMMNFMKIRYVRSPVYYSHMIRFSDKFPSLHGMMAEAYGELDSEALGELSTHTRMHMVDMMVMHQYIRTDDDNQFVFYGSKTGIIRKLKQVSKTGDRLIDWLVGCGSKKIMNTLVCCKALSDHNMVRMILLAQELDLFDRVIIEQYNQQHPTMDDSLKDIILNMIVEILNCGATRSFMFIAKIFPNLLSDPMVIGTMEKYGGTILHQIKHNHSADIVELICKLNRDLIDRVDKKGRTALIIYSELGLDRCIERLFYVKANIRLSDCMGDTYLHKLAKNGMLSTIHRYIRQSLEIIDTQNNMMESIAIIACKNGYEEIFYLLKGLRANIEQPDKYGNVCDHYICMSGICLGLMISNKKNRFGFVPKDYLKICSSFYYFD